MVKDIHYGFFLSRTTDTTSDYNGTKEHMSAGITWHGVVMGCQESVRLLTNVSQGADRLLLQSFLLKVWYMETFIAGVLDRDLRLRIPVA